MSERPINISGIDKFQLKCDCTAGSIVNGVMQPLSYSFTFDRPPGQK